MYNADNNIKFKTAVLFSLQHITTPYEKKHPTEIILNFAKPILKLFVDQCQYIKKLHKIPSVINTFACDNFIFDADALTVNLCVLSPAELECNTSVFCVGGLLKRTLCV